MRSKSYNVKPVVETLEGRQLFSAVAATGEVPFVGPLEAHEYAASQAQVREITVRVRATADAAKEPAPRPVMFWVRQDSVESPRIGGWLRAGSLLD